MADDQNQSVDTSSNALSNLSSDQILQLRNSGAITPDQADALMGSQGNASAVPQPTAPPGQLERRAPDGSIQPLDPTGHFIPPDAPPDASSQGGAPPATPLDNGASGGLPASPQEMANPPKQSAQVAPPADLPKPPSQPLGSLAMPKAGVPQLGALGSGVGATPKAPGYGLKNYLSDTQGSAQRDIDSLKAAQDAQDQAAKDSAYYAQGKAGVIQKGVDDSEEMQAANQRANQAAQARFTQSQKEIQARLDSVKDVDPNHFWNEKSTGEKILGVLAMGVGAYGAGRAPGGNGQNYAQQILGKAVENDIDAQKANREKEFKKISTMGDMAKDSFSKDQWMAEQRQKDMILGYKKVESQISSIEASSQSTQVQANAAVMRAQVQDKIKGLEGEMYSNQLKVAQAQQAQAGSGNPMVALSAGYKKYAEKRLDAGETPVDFQTYAKTMTGQPGGGGQDPLAGVPKDYKAKAQEELEKAGQHKADMNEIARLGDNAANTHVDVGPGYISSRKADDASDRWNAKITEWAHKEAAVRGLGPEGAEKLIESYKLSALTPQGRAQERVDSFLKDYGTPPATPLLDAYGKNQQQNAPSGIKPGFK